jgi:large-conductance mechanosensitive channel
MKLKNLFLLAIVIFLIINAVLFMIMCAQKQGVKTMNNYVDARDENIPQIQESYFGEEMLKEYLSFLNQGFWWFYDHLFICFLLQK